MSKIFSHSSGKKGDDTEQSGGLFWVDQQGKALDTEEESARQRTGGVVLGRRTSSIRLRNRKESSPGGLE